MSWTICRQLIFHFLEQTVQKLWFEATRWQHCSRIQTDIWQHVKDARHLKGKEKEKNNIIWDVKRENPFIENKIRHFVCRHGYQRSNYRCPQMNFSKEKVGGGWAWPLNFSLSTIKRNSLNKQTNPAPQHSISVEAHFLVWWHQNTLGPLIK